MTMFDLPPIPAELMDDQPITADDFEEAAALLDRAGLPEFGEMIEAAQDERPVLPGEAVLPPSFGRFQVTDDGTAEWALRKIAEQRARRAEVAAQAQGWRDEIDRWEAQQSKSPASFEAFLTGHLEAYMRARVDADPKLRTVTLPSGKLKATAAKEKVSLAESEDRLAELIAWADEHLDGEELAAVVKTTRTPMVGALRKIAKPSEDRLGDRYVYNLACGHSISGFAPADAPECFEPYVVGDVVPCHACPVEFGAAPDSEIEEVEVEHVTTPVVRSADSGEIIPGAVVTPASMTYNVVVG